MDTMLRPLTWVIDADGYPTTASLRSLKKFLNKMDVREMSCWLVKGFPALVSTIPYGQCEVTLTENGFVSGVGEWRIAYSTCGWSGQEALIDTVLGCSMLRLLYYFSWERGGHYGFRVPESHVKESVG
jgi:hypothetical protein